jgi:carbon storage regulator
MLVLTRQVGEKLVIGNEIRIEILSVSGDCVRLGIVAPRETSVHRYEVFEEIQAINRASSAPQISISRAAASDLAARLRARERAEETEREKRPSLLREK